MGSLHLPGILLADETALTGHLPRSLQESLFVLEVYAYKMRLHYNKNKSASIVFLQTIAYFIFIWRVFSKRIIM